MRARVIMKEDKGGAKGQHYHAGRLGARLVALHPEGHASRAHQPERPAQREKRQQAHVAAPTAVAE